MEEFDLLFVIGGAGQRTVAEGVFLGGTPVSQSLRLGVILLRVARIEIDLVSPVNGSEAVGTSSDGLCAFLRHLDAPAIAIQASRPAYLTLIPTNRSLQRRNRQRLNPTLQVLVL